jgi:hypothetical protein
VIDIAYRRVVGYATADHLRAEMVSDALANAVAARGRDPGVIFHSGRGCHTRPPSWPPSPPSATSRCPWAAPANAGSVPFSESFLVSLKGELLDLQALPTRDMARRAIVECIA